MCFFFSLYFITINSIMAEALPGNIINMATKLGEGIAENLI